MRGVSTIQASVVRLRGASKQIRSDKGPESIAKAIWAWMAEASAREELYIDPKRAMGERVRGGVHEPVAGAGSGKRLQAGPKPCPTVQFADVSDTGRMRGDVSSGQHKLQRESARGSIHNDSSDFFAEPGL